MKQKKKQKNKGIQFLGRAIKSLLLLPLRVFQLECRVIGRALITIGGK